MATQVRRLESVFDSAKPAVVYADVTAGENKSELQKDRLTYQPPVPKVLLGERRSLSVHDCGCRGPAPQ